MPLHYVDPHKKHGRWYQSHGTFRPLARGTVHGASCFASYRSRGCIASPEGATRGSSEGLSTAPLLCTGAKSGQPRVLQLTYFHDGPDPILVASNYGGAKHPQWYHNLKAHPECEFGDERFVATEVTDPDDYARLFGLAEQVYARLRRLSRQDRAGRPQDSRLPPHAAIAPLQAREAGVRVRFRDRRVLAGELADDSAVGHFDAVGVDAERIVVVQLLGEVVQCRLHGVLGQRAGDVENLQIEIAIGDNGFGRDAVVAGIDDDGARRGIGADSGDQTAHAQEGWPPGCP